jgi:MFS family permease
MTRTFAAWRRLPSEVWVLVVARTVNRLGAFTLPFLTVVLTDSFGASVATAGGIVALFGAATIPSRIIGGYLADAIGHRNTIVLGLLLTAVFQIALAVAPSIFLAALAAVMIGLAFEIYEPPSQALVADVVEGDGDRVTAYGLYSAALAAAGVVGGLLAALVGGIDLRLLFVADGITCIACAFLVRFGLRPHAVAEVVADDVEAKHGLAPSPWRDPLLLAMLAAGTGFAVLYLQLNVALPLTLAARGMDPSWLGLVFAISGLTIVVGQPLLTLGPVARLSHFRAMSFGFVLLGLGFALNGQVTSFPGFVVATILWSIGDLVLLGRAYALVALLAPAASRGRYMSVYGISWGVAAMLGPLLGTQLIEQVKIAGTWFVLAGLCGLLALSQPIIAAAAREDGRINPGSS